MTGLPDGFSNAAYWKEIYPQPPVFWQSSLDEIARRHFRQAPAWERARLGRNVVFLSEAWALKLCPPGWVEDIPRETAALGWVAGRLPVETPVLEHAGWLGGWGYTIQRRLAGRNLHELWEGLPPDQRHRLAFQHGEILAALHGLGLPGLDARRALGFDWAQMLAEQRSACAGEMASAGVNQALAGQVDHYLAGAAALLDGDAAPVVLHGDLTHLNFLAAQDGQGWRITGLIDWGDAKLGPRAHEYISPGVHMYLGDRVALAEFYRGCGAALPAGRFPREPMARAMLYYAGDFAHLLKKAPEINRCPDWECVARVLWGWD